MNTQPTPTPEMESEEERLKNMTEEERLEYLSRLDAQRRQEVLNILQSILSPVEWNSFSARYDDYQSSSNYLGRSNSPSPQPVSKSDRERIEEQDRQQRWEEEQLLKRQQEIKLVSDREQADEQAQAQRRAPAQNSFSIFPPRAPKPEAKAKPDLAESMSADSQKIMNSKLRYKSEFADYEDQFLAGNKAMLHDADSSVPFRGQVMQEGQKAFAIKQGQKLEDLLNKQHTSPLDASPADQAILKRASAAKRETQLQELDRSETAMLSAEKKLMRSIDDFRNGALSKALPDMMSAKNPADVKSVFESALSNGLIKREDWQAGMKNIGKSFTEYSNAVGKHAENLVKDDQESAAHNLLEQYVTKSKKISDENFLNEMSNGGFGDKLKEMTEKMSEMVEMVSNMVRSMIGSFNFRPVPS